jgi:hypothetical protein
VGNPVLLRAGDLTTEKAGTWAEEEKDSDAARVAGFTLDLTGTEEIREE